MSMFEVESEQIQREVLVVAKLQSCIHEWCVFRCGSKMDTKNKKYDYMLWILPT